MTDFVERLEGLMIENNLNKKTLAQKLNMNATCLTHYLQGKRYPTVESLIKIADYFHRSTDFLLGREEENDTLKFRTCPPFTEQLENLKNIFGCTAYQIYNNTGISKSSYYNWISGRQPTLDNIIKLANHFDCRVDFILGREA